MSLLRHISLPLGSMDPLPHSPRGSTAVRFHPPQMDILLSDFQSHEEELNPVYECQRRLASYLSVKWIWSVADDLHEGSSKGVYQPSFEDLD